MKTRVSCLISLQFATSDHLTLACPAGKHRNSFPLPLLCLLTFLLAGSALAGPDSVAVTNGVATAQGNQSHGIASGTDFPSSVNTLNVNSLTGAIQPGADTPGIYFANGSGGTVVINSGVPGTNVVITTSGSGAGISARSTGSVSSLPPPDPLLGIILPSGPAAPGGYVAVDSHSDITTTGDNAYGITGTSQTGGYPEAVVTGLESFTNTAGFNFTITFVDGSSTNIGQAVQGVMVDADGNATTNIGGTFILQSDGSFIFNLGNDFTNMAIGDHPTGHRHLQPGGKLVARDQPDDRRCHRRDRSHHQRVHRRTRRLLGHLWPLPRHEHYHAGPDKLRGRADWTGEGWRPGQQRFHHQPGQH